MTGADLRARRLALGLTQTELARRLGVHYATVLHWERGHRPLPPFLTLALDALDQGAQPATTARPPTPLIQGADWVRVTFDGEPDRATLNALRAAGFSWRFGAWHGPRADLPAAVADLATS